MGSPPQGYQNPFLRLDSSGRTVLVDTSGQAHITAYPTGRTVIDCYNPDGFVRTQGGGLQVGSFPITSYNSLAQKAQGVPFIVGFDDGGTGDVRQITVVDGSPITIRTTGSPPVASVYFLSIMLNIIAYTSGTVTYTLTFTKPDGNTSTLVVSGAALNAENHANAVVLVKNATTITVQATGPFVATADVTAMAAQML